MRFSSKIAEMLSNGIAVGINAKNKVEDEKDKLLENRKLRENQKKLAEIEKKKEEALKQKKMLKWAIPSICALIAIFGVLSIFEEDVPEAQVKTPINVENTSHSDSQPVSMLEGRLKVSFLDVGQGDAIFIELPNSESMLIDAGNPSDGDDVTKYIVDEGYNKIDYLIATHPHSDHIGGMAQVVESFAIKSIYMPKIGHTTEVFEGLLSTIEDKGLIINTAKSGVNIISEGNLKVDILAPVGDSYSDLNNYSAVIKVVYGNNTFIFMGDAEKLSEGQIMTDASINLNSDVLKVGHHGSDYSSGRSFLSAVSPKYAVISVGEGNQYGHPNNDTIKSLLGLGSKVYRTDYDGAIIFTSDGTNISVSKSPSTTATIINPPTEPETNTPQSSENKTIVYKTKSGEKYHSDGCRYLSKSKIEITLQQAKDQGLTPCSICHPPQ